MNEEKVVVVVNKTHHMLQSLCFESDMQSHGTVFSFLFFPVLLFVGGRTGKSAQAFRVATRISELFVSIRCAF